MKFFIALIVMLNAEQYPKVFTYQYVNFIDKKSCNAFLITYQDKLKESIEGQFGVDNLSSSAMICMTQDDINKISNNIERKKWQEQRHI